MFEIETWAYGSAGAGWFGAVAQDVEEPLVCGNKGCVGRGDRMYGESVVRRTTFELVVYIVSWSEHSVPGRVSGWPSLVDCERFEGLRSLYTSYLFSCRALGDIELRRPPNTHRE